MASSATRLSRLAQVSSALLDAVDALTEEFPEVPVSIIYEKVGEARGVAARYLPDPAAYRAVIEKEARRRLRFAGDDPAAPEVSSTDREGG